MQLFEEEFPGQYSASFHRFENQKVTNKWLFSVTPIGMGIRTSKFLHISQ
jgi:hypothetical protein